MAKILGLDLGTNSIGWAVVDTALNKILGAGVRIFPEGVEHLGEGKKEKSKNASRRDARQMRRQYFRKRLRRIKLLETLIDFGMCPLSKEQLRQWKYHDKTKGKSSRKFPITKEFLNWLCLNPYKLRAEALERNLTLQEFGRILYQLIHLRGFYSTRKVKEEGKMAKGEGDVIGFVKTSEFIKDKPSYGSAMYSISPKENENYKQILDKEGKELRVRARYTLRQWYVDEFEKIWTKQAEQLGIEKQSVIVKTEKVVGNPYRDANKKLGLKKRLQHKIDYLKSKGIKTELTIDDGKLEATKLVIEKTLSLRELLGGGENVKQEESILFYQRLLRSQKGLLNECSLEKTRRDENDEVVYGGKTPCPLSHPDAELKRAYEFINNIEYGNEIRLNEEQRKLVLDLINKNHNNFDFEKIPDELSLSYEKFNYDDKHKVPGNYTIKHLSQLFSQEVWEKNKYEIWHCFYFYSDNKKLLEKLKTYGLKEKDYEKITGKINDDGSLKEGVILKDGYSNFSLKAIHNILPFLEKGYKYSDAVVLGGVRNVFGKKWNELNGQRDEIEKSVMIINHDVKNEEGEAIERIKDYLIKNFHFKKDDKAFFGLYHHSQEIQRDELSDDLEAVPNLRNPIVQQALSELKKLVTELKTEHLSKGEHFAKIKVELARDLKQSKKRRKEQRDANLERENENTKARTVLDEFGLSYTRDNIHKYLLWKELRDETGRTICPYTGKTISLSDLFGRENKFQIEHIIPYSVSLDDSLGNKTLCDAKENGDKGERTPFQFYGSNEKRWEEISDRAFRILPYMKAKRFTNKTIHETDFISSQLNDTRYISKEAKDYLQQICSDVSVSPGQLTAELRHLWGLDTILSPPIEVSDETLLGATWAKLDKDGNPIAFYPIINRRPFNNHGEFIITGEIKEGIFESKFLEIKYPVENLNDGKYWAKVKVSNMPVQLVRVNKDLPYYEKEKEILLYGMVEKGKKFSSKFLTQKIDAPDLEENETYWAKLSIHSAKIDAGKKKEKKLKPKKDEILLYGKVTNKVFTSKIYSCSTDVEDGKYYAIVKVNLENVSFSEAKNKKPISTDKQVIVTGFVNETLFAPNVDLKQSYKVSGKDGLHWAVFDVKSSPYDFSIIKNKEPEIEKGKEELVEGVVTYAEILDVDKSTGEIFSEERRKVFFSGKQRIDHRHHAIDAIVVALTEQSHLQKLSTHNANKKAKYRNQAYDRNELTFPKPWDSFREEAERVIDQILVSHKQTNKVLTKKKTFSKKDGKAFEGVGARGQLHKEFVFGAHPKPLLSNDGKFTFEDNRKIILEKENGKVKQYYHIRKSLEDIKTSKHIEKIVDIEIKKIILNHIKTQYPKIDLNDDFNVPPEAFFKVGEDKVKQPRIFLPNRKGGEKVPIKKVRMREEMNNAERLKDDINQYVNPRNNHHVLIYKDRNENLKESVVTFWEVVARKKHKQPLIQLPPEDSDGTIITTMRRDDMFLLGINESEIDWEKQDNKLLSDYLYKVQKLAGADYFFELCFRKHIDARSDDEAKARYVYIKNFGDGKTGWLTYNPIKVSLSPTGTITKL